MKKNDKALLISLLGFPGAGHLYLKRTKLGIFYCTIVVLALIKIITYTVARAQIVADKILSGAVPLDPLLILELVKQKPPPAEALALNVATAALVIVWLVAAVDIYWQGKKASANGAKSESDDVNASGEKTTESDNNAEP